VTTTSTAPPPVLRGRPLFRVTGLALQLPAGDGAGADGA
jgi:hypothetical protein